MYYGAEISGFHQENFQGPDFSSLLSWDKWFVSMLWLNLQWFITDVFANLKTFSSI